MDGTDLLGSPVMLVAAAGFGALWGSFFNVCIARIPRGQSVVSPPSHCFGCGKVVRAWDNIPVLSYLLLRGRCRACGVKFSPRYLLVELLGALLSAIMYWEFVAEAPTLPMGLRLCRYAIYFAFASVLLVLSFIDLDTKRLPDVITLPAIPIFYLAGFAVQEAGWMDRAIGAAAGYLLVRLISDGYYYATGREGLGLGDGKLLAVAGALLGWKAIPIVIFMASFIGIFVSIPALLVARLRHKGETVTPSAVPPPALSSQSASEGASEGKSEGQSEGDEDEDEVPASMRHVQVPFGPFLALSALGYLVFHEPLWAWLSERLLLGF